MNITITKNIDRLIARLNSISNEELTKKEIYLIKTYLINYKNIINK